MARNRSTARASEFVDVKSSFPPVWVPEKVGDSIMGIYIGDDQIPGQRRGETFTSYRLELSEASDSTFKRPGEKEAEDMTMDKETVIGLSGGMLSSKFDQIPEGALVKVTYLGTLPSRSGNNPAKNFGVAVAAGTALLKHGAKRGARK